MAPFSSFLVRSNILAPFLRSDRIGIFVVEKSIAHGELRHKGKGKIEVKRGQLLMKRKPCAPYLKWSEKEIEFHSENRVTTFHNAPFPDSIVSCGKELLAAPLRVVGIANDEEIAWEGGGCFPLADTKDDCVINGFAISKWLILNTSYLGDQSGTLRLDVKISPCGLTENQAFGLEELPEKRRSIQKLFLEIPLSKSLDLFELSRFSNNHVYTFEGKEINEVGKIDEKGVRSGFEALVSLTDGEVGLSVAMESQKNWVLENENDAIEIEKTEEGNILRLKLINKNPASWTDDSEKWSPQLCFRFFLTPTPTKKPEKSYRQDKIVHLGCFEHIKDEQDYYSFLEDRFDEKETNFEHTLHSGAKTLILHERWNTMQSYWHYDPYTMRSLRKLVKKCHRHGIKVMVYFGFEVTSITHDFADFQESSTNFPREDVMYCVWYREPYQRATPFCASSKWMEGFIQGIFDTVDLFHLDGVYLDGTATPRPCWNKNHGCGTRDEKGHLHPTYPITETTKLIKTIAEGIHKRGGRVDAHSSGLVIPSIVYYVDSVWDGESIQTLIRDSLDKSFVFDAIRVNQTGPNVQFIAFNLREDWGIKQAQAYCLPCGIYTRANSIYQPLDVVKPIWQMIDSFGISKASFVGFWKNEEITVNNASLVVSYYQRKVLGKMRYLIYVSNPTLTKQQAEFSRYPAGTLKEWNGSVIQKGEILEFAPQSIRFFLLK